MNRDLFFLYVQNNRIGVLYFSVVTFIFIYGRFALNVTPQVENLIIAGLFLIIALLFLIKQQTLYKEILLEPNMPTLELRKKVWHIAMNKLGYMIPWLTVLFWPMQSVEFFDHIIGYIFIFSAIALYAATSANFYPLFLWDVAIQFTFAALVILLNNDMAEILYVAVALLISLCFSLFLGYRTYSSAREVVDKKHQLEYAKRKAESVSQAKSDFLAVMSHEVRTPLTGIMGMADFLKNSKLSKEQLSYIETIQSCSTTLLKTLNDALDLSKIEAGKLDISFVNYKTKQLLQDVIRTIETLANEKKLKLDLIIDPSLPEEAYGDADRLRQILLNLLSNAIKFTEKGKVTLKAKLNEDDNMMQFDVIDTGIGIGEKDQKKLFKKFSQIKHSMDTQYVGSGLGLSITKHLIQLMNGTIQVHSNPGEGSRFWFSIPYRKPKADLSEPIEELEKFKTTSISVLIVEDNTINQMVVEKIFKDKGHKPTIVDTGHRALELLDNNKYDLILMDVNLPDQMGTDVSRKIREKYPEHDDTPILAVTANIGKNIVKDLRQNGMDGYVAKPYDIKELVKTSLNAIKDRKGLDSLKPNIPSPDVHKQAHIEPVALSGKIDTLIDEFGIEYAQHYIQKSLKELDRLVEDACKFTESKDFGNLEKTAHDLKSICGSLDMTSSTVSAEIIETLIQQEFYKDLDKLVDGIKIHVSYETQSLQEILDQK